MPITARRTARRSGRQCASTACSAASFHGLIFARVLARLAFATAVSWSACRRSHQPSDSPKKRHSRSSVIVHDLDVSGIASRPAKADAELIVHPQAPLACTIALQLLETVRRPSTQFLDASREVALLQLAQRWTLDVGEAWGSTKVPNSPRRCALFMVPASHEDAAATASRSQ